MNFITRAQQVEEKLPETYVKYPHLIPFLQAVQDSSTKHMHPFQVLDYFTRTQKNVTKSDFLPIISRTVRIIHYILGHSYNTILKSGKTGVNYLVFTDTRMGSISMDFSSADINTQLANYSIQTKHRMDLDMVINNLHKPKEAAHIIFTYCNAIIEYAKKKHITNDFVFYNDTTLTYCKVGLDEVEESNYSQVVAFLENYWAKVNTKTGIDILDKTAMFSSKVYISQIDYIKVDYIKE